MENAHAKINGTEMHFSMRIYCAKAFSRASPGLGLPVFYQGKPESVRLQLKFSIRNEVSFHIASAFQRCECVFSQRQANRLLDMNSCFTKFTTYDSLESAQVANAPSDKVILRRSSSENAPSFEYTYYRSD